MAISNQYKGWREKEGNETMGYLCVQKRSAVLVPLPLQGHMTPMLQLGSILHSKGFSVIVAHTEFNSPNPLNHPDFVFLSLADKLAGFDTSFMNLWNVIAAINNNCRAPLLDHLVEMMKDQESHGQVSCIIYDAIMHFGEAIASQLNLPSMVLRTGGASYEQSYHEFLQLHAENCFPLPDAQLEEPVPGLDPLRFKDLPVSVSSVIPYIVIEFFESSINIRSSSAIIWNTTEDLEHSALTQLQQHCKVPFFVIGPFHKMAPTSSTSYLKEDRGCMAWLDKQAPNSVLYMSLGSLATIDEKELEETAWGLTNSGQPFLWVIRPSSVNGSRGIEKLPKGFQEKVGDRGSIVKWAPQKEVLAHPAVGGFWSHCGWNSTLESISEAVPIICRPCFADQMVNSRFLTYVWKVGLELEQVSDRGVIERTIKRLMVDKEGKEMRQRALDLKRQIESSIQEGGSSCRSLNELAEFILSFPLQK